MFEIVRSMMSQKISEIKKRKIKANDKIKRVLYDEPSLRGKLIAYSDKFSVLREEWLFDLIVKNITFEELAKSAELDIADMIEFLNSEEADVKENLEKPTWVENGDFLEIDARELSGFFLKDILAKEARLPKGKGLKIIQNFHAAPLISLLESKGYKSYTEKISNELFNFYFWKENNIAEKKEINISITAKPQMVIQSATPVIYPVLLKLLNSEEVKKAVEITEYKVWEETEKHLGWIVNGKADLSFSAVLAMSNLASNKDIVKMTSVAVWDNFYLLTRGFKAKDWNNLKGRDINMPLFFNAPPAKVTHYLMKKAGIDPKDFSFVYGKPFGRPEIIYKGLVEGVIDVALLREPEVSYALTNNEEIYESFSYNNLWKRIHPESKGLPNAGVVFKREWMEKFPEETKLVITEIDKAISWVKENKEEAAKLSYKEMGHTYDEVYKFLTRVHFENIEAKKVKKEIVDYLSVIDGEEKAKIAVDKML